MSETYTEFASLYDNLMDEAPYNEWVNLVERMIAPQRELLELGAGTGTLAAQLIQKGYQLTVSDLSEDMLAIAEQKMRSIDETALFYVLDMRNFRLDHLFDGVLLFCDAINYLSDEQAVKETFQSVYSHLKDGGVFLFDAHSIRKIERFLDQQTFGSSEPSVSYLWECFPGDADHSVIHDLTFFVQQDNGSYSRVEETHEQRTYPLDFFVSLLKAIGFVEVSVVGDFDDATDLSACDRWCFVAKKPSS
ncbi:MAG TPA: class I SAM-dependent methyltransferase [Candidatus Angelobacter sp.]|nr:class I SAM-dependent methyltransferase [Candidatus Angelobacter sp.]